jgi:hypothetical protein
MDPSKLATFSYENMRTEFHGFPQFLQAEAGTVSQTNVGLLHSTPFAMHYSRKSYQGLFISDIVIC